MAKPKHNVSYLNDKGTLRLFWRYNRKPYVLSPKLKYTEENIQFVQEVVYHIRTDMETGNFDPSKAKYVNILRQMLQGLKGEEIPLIVKKKVVNKARIPKNKIIPYKPKPSDYKVINIHVNQHIVVKDFIFWAENFKHVSVDGHNSYHHAKNMFLRWGNFKLEEVFLHLNKEKICAKIYNARLHMLKAFFNWAMKHKNYRVNPVEDINRKPVKRTKIAKRLPFSPEEITKILDAIKTDKFKSKHTNRTHSYYYPFLYFMFSTGVRPAEAVGLRVKNVLVGERRIRIEEVLASNYGKPRVRKETKNGKIRKIPLNDDLKEVLLPLLDGKQPDDLVFVAYKGGPINDANFQLSILTPVQKKLKIPVRDLYACRHTAATNWIRNNINPVTVSLLMGNNPETALRNYVHLEDIPEKLPDFI